MNFYLGIQRITISSARGEEKSKIFRSNTVSACQFEPELLLLPAQTAQNVSKFRDCDLCSHRGRCCRIVLTWLAWFAGAEKIRNKRKLGVQWLAHSIKCCYARYLTSAWAHTNTSHIRTSISFFILILFMLTLRIDRKLFLAWIRLLGAAVHASPLRNWITTVCFTQNKYIYRNTLVIHVVDICSPCFLWTTERTLIVYLSNIYGQSFALRCNFRVSNYGQIFDCKTIYV